MTTKEKILTLLQNINYYYNDCTMYDCIKNLLEEMVEELRPESEYRVPKNRTNMPIVLRVGPTMEPIMIWAAISMIFAPAAVRP